MNAYATLHLSLAALCAFFAVAHFVLWIFVPPDRAQLYGGFALAGLALLDLGVAGSGEGSGSPLGPAAPWIVVAMAGGSMLWWSFPRCTWELLNEPYTRARRTTVLVLAALSLLRLADIVYVVAADPAARVSWEAATGRHIWAEVLAKLTMLVIAVILTADGVQAFRRRNLAGIFAIIGGTPGVALMMREILVARHFIEGHSLVGLVGVPFMISASMVIGSRYVAAQRRRQTLEKKSQDIGGYHIIRPLDSGGMGDLFLAARVGPGGFQRHLAVKRIRADVHSSPEEVERLLREARLAARLHHPNIVDVYDIGHDDTEGRPGWFIAMEYLPGVNVALLRDRARKERAPIPPEVVAALGEQIAEGLGHAHDAGILHRDMSPYNVMVTFDGEVKIVDFGVATELKDASMLAGRFEYLSPEVLRGEPASPRSDVFALGVTLYELLGPQRPFRGADRKTLAAAHAAPTPPLPETVPPALEAAVLRALERDPARRFESARAFASALRGARGRAPVDLRPWLVRHCLREWARERRLALLEGIDDRSRHADDARPIAAARAEETLRRVP
ncbi:MAG TPA: serine/threonine-protein kinase [bacterium]|nr:serine/threonine-protein kinase [bacterium]